MTWVDAELHRHIASLGQNELIATAPRNDTMIIFYQMSHNGRVKNTHEKKTMVFYMAFLKL